jgi:hypothetical protein
MTQSPNDANVWIEVESDVKDAAIYHAAIGSECGDRGRG